MAGSFWPSKEKVSNLKLSENKFNFFVLPSISDADSCSEIAQDLLKKLMLATKQNKKLFFDQVLRIYDKFQFFGSDLSPWLRNEINGFMNDQEWQMQYQNIFTSLVSYDYEQLRSPTSGELTGTSSNKKSANKIVVIIIIFLMFP